MVPAYIAMCIATALLALVVNLRTPTPRCTISHVRQFARVLVFGAALASAVRAGKVDAVTSESMAMVFGVMLLLAAQARLEVMRQRREACRSVPTTRGVQ